MDIQSQEYESESELMNSQKKNLVGTRKQKVKQNYYEDFESQKFI